MPRTYPGPEFARSAAVLDSPRTRTSVDAGEVVTGAIVPTAWNKPVLAVLATDEKQSDGMALDMAGCDLKRYRRNNVLIVGHNVRSLAVGSVEDIRVADVVVDDDGEIYVDAPFSRSGKRVKALVGRLDFDRETTAGREAEASVRSGKTRGISIGFDIDKSSRDWRTGKVGRWWPTETSLLAVPMDEFARVYSRSYDAPATQEDGMFDDVDPGELRRAVVDLCVRMGIGINVRGETVGWTRDADTDYTRAAASDEDDYDDESDDDLEEEADNDDGDLEDEDGDLEDEEDDVEDEEDDEPGERGWEGYQRSADAIDPYDAAELLDALSIA